MLSVVAAAAAPFALAGVVLLLIGLVQGLSGLGRFLARLQAVLS